MLINFGLESSCERIVIIARYFTKLSTRVGCLVFWLTLYYDNKNKCKKLVKAVSTQQFHDLHFHNLLLGPSLLHFQRPRTLQSTAIIRTAQACAATSAIAELLFCT